MAEATAFVAASPLIGLASVGGLAWLPRLYRTAFDTQAVRDEVTPGLTLPGERLAQTDFRLSPQIVEAILTELGER